MPKAIEVAAELRKLADALGMLGDMDIDQPYIHMNERERETFLAVARVLPRPIYKDYDQDTIRIRTLRKDNYGTLAWSEHALNFRLEAPRNRVCRMIEPAKPAVYECDALLSEEEESELTEASNVGR